MTKMHVILALEKGVKTRRYAELTQLNKNVQRVGLFGGLSRTYRPKDDEGDALPGESTLVQVRAVDALAQLRDIFTQSWNLEATKDATNAGATADVIVDDVTLLRDVHATYLLYLEKQLDDVRTFIGNLPVLDPAETWEWDDARDCWATPATETTRTRKVPKNHVLYEATVQHPAQVQVFHEDVVEGFWATVKFSGALPSTRRRELLARVDKLRDAVKSARERANEAEVVTTETATPLLDYLLGSDGSAPGR